MHRLVSDTHTVRRVRVSERAPEEPIRGGAPVGDVVEEDLQLVVIVKVSSDHGAGRRGHGELLGGDVLRGRTTEKSARQHRGCSGTNTGGCVLLTHERCHWKKNRIPNLKRNLKFKSICAARSFTYCRHRISSELSSLTSCLKLRV